jgi:hypothetical protein
MVEDARLRNTIEQAVHLAAHGSREAVLQARTSTCCAVRHNYIYVYCWCNTDLWIRRFAAEAAANSAECGWGARPAAAALAIFEYMGQLKCLNEIQHRTVADTGSKRGHAPRRDLLQFVV